ncbi:MAG: class I SAM-dependent methyltransferase [Chloroflexota bacterium]
MANGISPRLAAIVEALPLKAGIRVLEIGCGPGAAARAVSNRIGNGCVLGIDRSATAIAQAVASSQSEIASGRLNFRQVSVEEFVLQEGEEPYDIAFAVRVGALDGRHPELEKAAFDRIAQALVKGGRLFLDGGDPLREVSLTQPNNRLQRTASRRQTGVFGE